MPAKHAIYLYNYHENTSVPSIQGTENMYHNTPYQTVPELNPKTAVHVFKTKFVHACQLDPNGETMVG